MRGSVWVEQEIAIAAFIQHALKRKLEVAIYLQKGIHREGIREQLRLLPVEFEKADDVLTDFRDRLPQWMLNEAPEYSLAAMVRFTTDSLSGALHNYRLFVDLVNVGKVQVKDWRVKVEIPKEFVRVRQGLNDVAVIEEDSSALPPADAKIYPGEKRTNVVTVAYFVDDANYDLIDAEDSVVKVTLWSGDMPPSVLVVPLSQLNEF